MRAIAKPIFILIGILLLFITIATLCLDLYLQSQGTQQRLTEEFAKITKVPVSIQGTFGSPLGRIKLQGIVAGEKGRNPFLSIDSVMIRPDYMQLLHGRLEISRIVLDHPVIHLTLGQLPGTQSPEKNSNLSLVSSLSQGLPQQPKQESFSSLPHSEAQKENSIHPSNSPSLSPQFLMIKNGEFTLQDENGNLLLSLTGIGLKAEKGENGWNGQLKAQQALLLHYLAINKIRSSLHLPEDLSTLALESFAGSVGGGDLSGKALFALHSANPDYSLFLKLEDASIRQALLDASITSSSTEGSISGNLTLSGTAGKGASMQGNGELSCKNGTIQPMDSLKQIGQLLSIDELQLLRLAEGKLLFRIEGGHFVIENLFLRSENLILAAKGPLHPSGELDLDSRLLFNEKLAGRLRGLLGSKLSPAPEAGYSQLSFHISGTALSPKTDLLERLTGLRINSDLGGLIQGFFGHPAPRTQPPQ